MLHATEKENNQSEDHTQHDRRRAHTSSFWTAVHCLMNMYFKLIGSEKDTIQSDDSQSNYTVYMY